MARMLLFLAGVSTLCFVDSLWFFSYWVYCLALALCAIALAHLRLASAVPIKLRLLNPALLNLIQLGGLFLLGLLYGQWAAQTQLDSRLPHSLDGKEAMVTGSVIGLVEKKPLDGQRQSDYYQRFLFKVDSFNAATDNKNNKSPKIIQINNYRPIKINTGEHWQFRLKLKRPRGTSNPGGFDYTRYLFAKRIDATAYIKSIDEAKRLRLSGGAKTFRGIADQLRSDRVAVLNPIFAALKQQGLLSALLIGDRSHISPEHQLLLQRTGTAHLLAISGLHIGISLVLALLITKALLLFFPKLMLYCPRALIVSLVALPIAAFYAVLAGLSVSTQRALFMLLCFALIILLRRHISIFNTLCVAAFLVVLIDPLAVLSAGFWFSFTAVAVLLISSLAIKYRFTAGVENTARAENNAALSWPLRYWLKIKLLLSAQLAIFIAMPLTLSAFGGQQSLIAPIANLVTIPIISIAVVPLGIAAILFSYLSLPVAKNLLSVADYFLGWSVQLLEFIDSIANTFLSIDTLHRQTALSPILFVVSAVSIIILLGRWRLPGVPAAFMIWLCLVDPFGLFDPRQNRLSDGEFWLTQFDVGQGSAILITSRDYQLLYDTGPKFSAVLNAANAMIEPYLDMSGNKHIDTIVVSHGDNDHAGGVEYIDKHWQVGEWLLGGSANTLSISAAAKPCTAGQQWQKNRLRFSVLHPDKNLPNLSNENDQSCVLLIQSLSFAKHKPIAQLLLTGDISREVEQQLAESYNIRADMLIVPHHGSISSSSAELLTAVKPERALVSMAYRNRYRHPHHKVVERYLNRDISFYRSDQLGAMQFRYIQGQWYGPYCSRYLAEHFWQDFDNRQQCVGPFPS